MRSEGIRNRDAGNIALCLNLPKELEPELENTRLASTGDNSEQAARETVWSDSGIGHGFESVKKLLL